jgi:hypothetical protein
MASWFSYCFLFAQQFYIHDTEGDYAEKYYKLCFVPSEIVNAFISNGIAYNFMHSLY